MTWLIPLKTFSHIPLGRVVFLGTRLALMGTQPTPCAELTLLRIAFSAEHASGIGHLQCTKQSVVGFRFVLTGQS